jgi:hypothetical protein
MMPRSSAVIVSAAPGSSGFVIGRRIIGYRDLATLVIAIERHAIRVAPNNLDRQHLAKPVTV